MVYRSTGNIWYHGILAHVARIWILIFSAFALFFFSACIIEYAMDVGVEFGLVAIVKVKDYHIWDMRCKCWVSV